MRSTIWRVKGSSNSGTWEMDGIRVKIMYQFRYVSSERMVLPSGNGVYSLTGTCVIEIICYGMEREHGFSSYSAEYRKLAADSFMYM